MAHPKKMVSMFHKDFMAIAKRFEKSKNPFALKKDLRRMIAETFLDALDIHCVSQESEKTANQMAKNIRNALALKDSKDAMEVLGISELQYHELRGFSENSTLVEQYLNLKQGQELPAHVKHRCADEQVSKLKAEYFKNTPTVLKSRDSMCDYIVDMQAKANASTMFDNVEMDADTQKNVNEMKKQLKELDETIESVALALNKLDNTRGGKTGKQVIQRRCAASLLSIAVVVVGIAAIITASIILSGGLSVPAIASACVYPVTGMMWEHYNKGFLSVDNIHEAGDKWKLKKQHNALESRLTALTHETTKELETAGGVITPGEFDKNKPQTKRATQTAGPALGG